MGTFGYAASFEQFHPTDLLGWSKRAEQNGFSSVMASDHFHPWLEIQGHSPFAWSVLGAIASTTTARNQEEPRHRSPGLASARGPGELSARAGDRRTAPAAQYPSPRSAPGRR